MPESDDKTTIQMLMAKLDSMHYKSQDLVRLGRQGKLLSIIVVLAIAGAAFFSLYRTYSEVTSHPPEAYMNALELEIQILRPRFEQHMNQFAKNVIPVYREAFEKEFVDGMPEISRVATEEATEFLGTLGERFEARLAQGMKKIAEEHAGNLAKDHPILANPVMKAKVMEHAEEIYYSAAEEVARDVFEAQTQSVANLGATLDTFETPETHKTMKNDELIAHTFDTLLSILGRRLSFIDMPEIPTPSGDDSTRKAR